MVRSVQSRRVWALEVAVVAALGVRLWSQRTALSVSSNGFVSSGPTPSLRSNAAVGSLRALPPVQPKPSSSAWQEGDPPLLPGEEGYVEPKDENDIFSSFEGEDKDGKKQDGNFFSRLLKVEQDIELSPEEYEMALEQEMDAQRKKNYIGGVIKPNNLVVPWKTVDEVQIKKDAKRQLKKNGITDPSGADDENQMETAVDFQVIGGQDVRLAWGGGAPGQKVGYVVERKKVGTNNYVEIATYDNMRNPQLLVKSYAGHEFDYIDEIVKPGKYTYRVLCRFRSGEITIVDEKDVFIPEPEGLSTKNAGIVLGVIIFGTLLGGYLLDPPVQF
eukprot:CAMPEP_0115094512 /NCGR_PEP_ID=MMETSP0227-20121206/28408_1 /TAXON_ID=89957 /ORGANISM="Polarella glacialis, Strain CCMP 1383" /LENGTH=329 /DNA_ID=CAMNT_0002487541 /DNA_START=76 /DNA_END=1065 /DNA_ORIENTATION=-